jgi:hypothetical protein
MLNTLPSEAVSAALEAAVEVAVEVEVDAAVLLEELPQAASPKLSAETPARERNCLREIFFMFNPPEKF